MGEKHEGSFGLGEPNVNFSKYFIGNSYLNPLTDMNKTSLFIANVTFEPKCRNNWHIHKSTNGGGQILICVDGEGWYQEVGKEARKLKVGDVVTIPANVKHWHGATSSSWFSHLAIEVPGKDTENIWCEPVTDEEYEKLEEHNIIEYRIYKSVYDEMTIGKKNVEIRLLNEKSEKIKIGDKIKFKVEDTDLYLIVEVTNKYIYSDIDELYENKDIVLNCVKNYTKEECLNALFEIFGKEKVLSSKLIGIEFKILNKKN